MGQLLPSVLRPDDPILTSSVLPLHSLRSHPQSVLSSLWLGTAHLTTLPLFFVTHPVGCSTKIKEDGEDNPPRICAKCHNPSVKKVRASSLAMFNPNPANVCQVRLYARVGKEQDLVRGVLHSDLVRPFSFLPSFSLFSSSLFSNSAEHVLLRPSL